MSRCELKKWIDDTTKDAKSNPETFVAEDTTFVCTRCGHLVSACVTMANGEIHVSSDSCQDRNPPSLTRKSLKKQPKQLPLHESRTISKTWFGILFGSIAHWLNPKYGQFAENINARHRMETEYQIMWDHDLLRRSGGKQG